PEQMQDELEMLQLFDRDPIQFLDLVVEVAIFFKIQRRSRCLALQVRMIHEHLRHMAQNFWQPVRWNLLTKQQHAGLIALKRRTASGNEGFPKRRGFTPAVSSFET